jgi:hypothetical protein
MPALTHLSTYDLDKGFYGWRGQTTTSNCPSYWAPLGIHKIFVYPMPSNVFQLVYLYLQGNSRLTANADYLDLGDEEILRLIDYAAWLLSFKQGLKEAFENTNPFRELFLLAAGGRNARLRSSALYRKFMGEHRDEEQPTRMAQPQKGVRG